MNQIFYQQFSDQMITVFHFFSTFVPKCQDNIKTMIKFGERVRELREQNNLLLRQLAAKLDIDAAQLSKIEHGIRKAKREQVIMIADVLNTDKDELLSLWLAAKVYDVIKDEAVAKVALKEAGKQIKK
jgi:transcriptional regulator with XRE-family HTH domain